MALKRKITGTVISNKNDKTIDVEVSGHRYYAHDELNEAQVGDVVTIEETRPLSALKRFKLISIDKKALENVEVSDGEDVAEVLHEDKEEE